MKSLVQNFLLAAIPSLICLELLGLITAMLVPKLFASPSLVAAIAAVDAPRYAEFKATAMSPTIGWDHVPGSTRITEDCDGGRHVATYDGARARSFPSYEASRVTAILIGDSYTHGDEVGDEQTIAAHLFRQDRIMAANLGVGGYSPLQAVLKAKARHADYPNAKAIVLGVMYENLRRNVNGYVPIYSDDERNVFGLRPHLIGETLHQPAAEAVADVAQFKAQAIAALETDFWARPAPHFPYAVSLIRALSSNSGVSRIKATANKMRDRQYEADYGDTRLTVPLFAVVRDFFLWSQQTGLEPAVIFMPQNRRDRTSAALWIRDFAPRLPGNGVVIGARMEGADWSRFNQGPDQSCHPSGYGYATLATAYAETLKPLLRGRAP